MAHASLPRPAEIRPSHGASAGASGLGGTELVTMIGKEATMKNGKRVTDYLDYCAETSRLATGRTVEDVEAANERFLSGEEIRLWQACLDDGWTVAELNAAYVRRFSK